jgi:hypothetical protein
MFLDFLLCKTEWYSRECALTWKVKAMKSSRLLFQLVPRVRRTGGTGFGLLHTPMAIYGEHPGMTSTTHLTGQIAMLPTPHGNCSTGPGTEGREGGENIQTAIGKSTGMKLQPAFVEWMMGYPIGFTDLKH